MAVHLEDRELETRFQQRRWGEGVTADKFDAVVKFSGKPVPDPLPLAERALVKGAGK